MAKTNEIKLSRDLGMLRVGVAVPRLRVADVDFNVAAIIKLLKDARRTGVQVLVFPETSITGYTINDLVQHQALLDKTRDGLAAILKATADIKMLVAVGLPLEVEQKIFNCAAVINSGDILGIIPKTYLPTYREFYDARWFAPAGQATTDAVEIAGQEAPFGTDILFQIVDTAAIVGVELCEDLWMPLAPHQYQSAGGANVLLNLSASNEILGKADWRRTMISSESGRCIAAYCYASSGIDESSNDEVFGGHGIIAENGVILSETKRLVIGPQLIISDIDIDRLNHDRRAITSFHVMADEVPAYTVMEAEVNDFTPAKLHRFLDPHPFVPKDPTKRAERCKDIFAMQVAALAQKLNGAKRNKIVLGVSGGLDSTLALLVAAKTMDFLKLPRKNVYAYNLPGFGTTQRTKNNAGKICEALGVTFSQVDITRTAEAHLKDLGHKGQEDVVFENVQARYRTEFFFNKANEVDGIHLGTGDLTEVALGWSTFSGDQISHYHVNVSVPKTLVKYLIKWVADEELKDSAAQKPLYSVLDTPISPELLRHKNGDIVQKSEETIGPVELADFYLYPFIRFGMRPGKMLYLANEVNKQKLFEGKYNLTDLHKWLKSFITRFFANQFKRTLFPEGPKIGSVSLSPRGDWRMPSEASPALWLEDLEAMFRRLRK